MPVHSLCNARTPQPCGLEAYKTSKGIKPDLPGLLYTTLSGTRRHVERIPPLGGIFSISRLYLNSAAQLPCLPQSSQKALLLAIFGRKTFFNKKSFFAPQHSRHTDVRLVSIVKNSTNLLISRFKTTLKGYNSSVQSKTTQIDGLQR